MNLSTYLKSEIVVFVPGLNSNVSFCVVKISSISKEDSLWTPPVRTPVNGVALSPGAFCGEGEPADCAVPSCCTHQGSGLGVWGFGFRDSGFFSFGLRAWGSRIRDSGHGFRVPGLGVPLLRFGFGDSKVVFRVSCFVFRVPGSGIQDSVFGFRSSGLGIRVSGFGFWDSKFAFRVLDFVFRARGSEIQDSGFGFRDSGSGFRDSGVLRCLSSSGLLGRYT